MARTVKTIKSSSKKFLKEADVPEFPEDIGNETEEMMPKVEQEQEKGEYDDEDEDDAPEAVSMSTSKAEIINRIKSEREARRLDHELKRKKTVSMQEQNRQARLRKTVEKDEISDEDTETIAVSTENQICPLPENIFETAIQQQQQQNQKEQQNQIRFESENESTSFLDSKEIRETVRLQRVKATKRRLIESLPFAVVEVGFKGKARISKAEIKARRAISKLKMERAGSQVRRIDSVLDRARKTRSAPNVFYRQNSFY